MSELFKALAAAQAKFPEISKDKVNPHFKSKYVSLDAILSATRPALTENGLAVSSRFGENSIEAVLMHAGGEQITSGPVPLMLGKNDMQGLGSAITYARRYAIGALLGISPDEDDDGNAAAASAKENPYRKPVSPPPEPSTNGQAKPKATPAPKAKALADFATPATLATALGKMLDKKPVKDDPKRWQEIYDECGEVATTKTGNGTWTSESCDPLHVVLDRIKGAIELEQQSEVFSGK